MPNARTKEGFGPNAYKVIEKADYDLNYPTVLGKVVEVESYDLNKMQKKIQEQKGLVIVSKDGLGYTTPKLIRV